MDEMDVLMTKKDVKTILVAESDHELRQKIKQFLEGLGYYVLEAGDGQQAITIFEQVAPPLVLLGAEMPVVSGLEVCKKIRQLDRKEYSPVLVISKNNEHAFVEHAFEAGAADVLHKPIHWALLQYKIEYMLRASERAYTIKKSEAYLHSLFQSLPLGYKSLDKAGNYVNVNPAWSAMTGYHSDDVIGTSCVDNMHPDSKERFFEHLTELFKEGGGSKNIEFQYMCRDGGVIDIEFNGHAGEDENGEMLHAHCLIVDITERKKMETELVELANTDMLTGIYNRRAFLEQAEKLWILSRRYQRPLNTLMIDIDHFKSINDNYGHAKGDEVLRDVAAICKQTIRESDTFGRIGGEEFAVLFPETGLDNALLGAERIRQAVESLQFSHGGDMFRTSISIGVAERKGKDDSFDLLLQRADNALYKAKQRGRNRVAFSV